MTAETPDQASRRLAGIKDYACGLCGEEFGSNLDPGDIKCTNCEARLCPCCEAWFNEDGDSSQEPHAPPGDAERLAIALAALREIVQDGDNYSACKTAEEALSDIADLSPRLRAQPESADGPAPDEGELAAARLLTAHAHEAIAAAIGREEAAEAKVAEARKGIGNFLGEYGDSEIPMFKVAQDLANSIRKILSDEEASDARRSPRGPGPHSR